MDVKLYTGNGSTQTISGLGFESDLIWIKNRSNALGFNHVLQDSLRGFTTGKKLSSNLTTAEGGTNLTDDFGYVSGVSSTGFSLTKSGTGSYDYFQTNGLNDTYVAWAWDAGSSTVTNTAGSISSQVRANASAGFSIVTYTGNGTTGTVGHGLGVAPGMVIIKSRSDGAANWTVWHSGLTNGYYIYLNTTGAQTNTSASQFFGNTSTTVNPSSTVITLGGANAVNNSSPATYVAYCFAPVAGYSSFGSYTGNGSSDGPFVYTGFRPKYVLVKGSSAVSDWWVNDSVRSAYNQTASNLVLNGSAEEYTGNDFNSIDILSNGFKMRNTNTSSNQNSTTYIYAAFAESPFQYARAR
jgi:hypothetical protein